MGKIRQALMLHIHQLNMLNNINALINDTFDMFLHTGQQNLTFKTKCKLNMQNCIIALINTFDIFHRATKTTT